MFDYGDCWEFDIVLDVKHETGVALENSEIIKSVGEAPEQYPDMMITTRINYYYHHPLYF